MTMHMSLNSKTLDNFTILMMKQLHIVIALYFHLKFFTKAIYLEIFKCGTLIKYCVKKGIIISYRKFLHPKKDWNMYVKKLF